MSAFPCPPDTMYSVKAKLLFLQLCSCPLPEGHASTEWELRLFERKLVPIWISTALWRMQALENPISHTDLVLGLMKQKLLLWIHKQQSINSSSISTYSTHSSTFGQLYSRKTEVNNITSHGKVFYSGVVQLPVVPCASTAVPPFSPPRCVKSTKGCVFIDRYHCIDWMLFSVSLNSHTFELKSGTREKTRNLLD